MRDIANITFDDNNAVSQGFISKKVVYFKYLKGRIRAKYEGKVLNSHIFSGNANSISKIIDLIFVTSENEIFDSKPNFDIYENSKNVLGLFNFPGKVKVAVENNSSHEDPDYYDLEYEKIELITSYKGENVTPYEAIHHQREEKSELGTFTGNAILIKKFIKETLYYVEIEKGSENKMTLFNDKHEMLDEINLDDDSNTLYQVGKDLFLKTYSRFFHVNCSGEKLHLGPISSALKESETKTIVAKKANWIHSIGLHEPVIKKPTASRPTNAAGLRFFTLLGWLVNLLSLGFGIVLISGFIYFMWTEAPVLGIILVALFGLSWISSVWEGLLGFIGRLFTYVFFPLLSLMIIGSVVFALFQIIPNLCQNTTRNYNYAKDDYRETVERKYQSNGDIYRITRVWKDYGQKEHIITFDVLQKELFNSENHKERLNQTYDFQNIGKLYTSLSQHDFIHLQDLKSKLIQLKVDNQLTELQFSQLLMSFIQDFPYALVLSNDCEDPINSSQEFVRSYLADGGECLGREKFGVLTPLEFMSYSKGDCDSRTTFAYGLFKEFGYDVCIFNSAHYAHSIFGISFKDEQLQGAFKTFNQKRYYLWETTAIGFNLGDIPSDQLNMNHWFNVTSKQFKL